MTAEKRPLEGNVEGAPEGNAEGATVEKESKLPKVDTPIDIPSVPENESAERLPRTDASSIAPEPPQASGETAVPASAETRASPPDAPGVDLPPDPAVKNTDATSVPEQTLADKTDGASPVPDSVKPEAHVDVSPAPENSETVVNTVVSKEADAAPLASKPAAEDNEKVANTGASPAIVVTKIRKLRSANSKASPSSEPIPDGDHVTKQESLSPEPVPEDAINEAEDADDALEIFDDDDAEQILQTKMRHGYTHILEEEEPNMEKFILQRKKELADNYELELDEIE